MDVHQSVVTAALAANSNAETPRKVSSEARTAVTTSLLASSSRLLAPGVDAVPGTTG
jgi:hypothetical protein